MSGAFWPFNLPVWPAGPTLAGFNTFVYDVMKIDPLALPTTEPVIGYAYAAAIGVANAFLGSWTSAPGGWSTYTMAAYNLAGSNLVNYAQDQPGRTFFSDLRDKLGITKFQPGVVSATSDGGTSVSLLNPDIMKTLTLANLQQLKDPWGRAYLAIAQDFGTLWGIS